MKRTEQVLRGICTYAAIIAGVLLVAMMAVTVADVFLRAFFSKAIMGSSEISCALMVAVGFLGIAWCAWGDQHIKVDMLVGLLSRKSQKHFFKFNYIIVAAISAIISVESFNEALEVFRLRSQSQLLEIPHYPFYLIVTFSYLLLCLTGIVLLIKSFYYAEDTEEKRKEAAETCCR